MPSAPNLHSSLLQAALGYARSGWKVFPCRERDEQFSGRNGPVVLKAKSPYVSAQRDAQGNKIPNSGGLRLATTDERQIVEWWTKWPNALIGAATGRGMDAFVVDFDIFDKQTGEFHDVEDRLADLEAAIGVPLPETAMAQTSSGGCHLYFALPDVPEGMRLGNSNKNLPFQIDVRGDDTGYVIVPPSRRLDLDHHETRGEYRWLRRYSEVGALPAPAELLNLLFVPVKGSAPKSSPAAADRPRPGYAASDDPVIDALRKYGLRALDGECRDVREARSGGRNNRLNEAALKIAALTVATPYPALDATLGRAMLEAAARDNPGDDDDAQLLATIASGWSAGIQNPRDLGEIAAAARDRAARAADRAERNRSRAAGSSRAPRPDDDPENGKPSSQGGCAREKDGGRGGGEDDEAALLIECAGLPQTDLGNLQRFLRRHGHNFLFVEQWGWLAWDGTRWNRDMAVPLLGRAVQDTMRAIQREAAFVRASGVQVPPPEGDIVLPVDPDDDDEPQKIKDDRAKQKRLKSLLWFKQRDLARQTGNGGDRHDFIAQVKSNGDIVLHSDKLATWGRTSEAAGHISCIPKMAEARLAAKPGDFDADPLLVNMANGTLIFRRPEGGTKASVERVDFRREDRITKIGTAIYDPAAACAAYDVFLERVQPDAEMRTFLDVWAGYNMLGDASAQKMAIFYGEGSNGKGVWINTKRAILGDYAWATSINTFLDAGRQKKGSDASPDLAALAGRRMVYANEADEGTKFSDALVKELTSDEPKGGVRELHMPPFELQITFKNTIICNNKPRIGTDHGIQRRIQIVPWSVIIPAEERDPRLKAKLVEEASGILNRMVRGALQFLDSDLPVPEAIREATKAYIEENDILGQFLTLCIEKVPGEEMGATPFHELFVAWQTWAQLLPANGKPWSPKYLSNQMDKKGFRKRKSSSMIWDDIWPRYWADDFLDSNGKPREGELAPPRSRSGTSPLAPIENNDDDFPPV